MSMKTLILPLFFLSIFWFSYSASAADHDYSEVVKISKNLNATIHYEKWDIQKTFRVPDIQLLWTKGNQQILAYRTDFHNGTENGCLRVFGTVKAGKLHPFYVLEEVFWLTQDNYYQRVVTSVSPTEISFDLYEVKSLDKHKLLSARVRRDAEGRFRLESSEEFRRGISNGVLHFSDVYESLAKKILRQEVGP